MNEHDRGWQNCMDEKVAPLYAKVEDAITDLHQTVNRKEIQVVVSYLLKALKEADK